jgi:putative membrane protein
LNKATILLAAGALVISSPAPAQTIGEKTGINSALGISPTTADFVNEATNSDMLEIGAAKIAEDKGNVEEKKFAQQMITDHTKTTSDLKGLVTGGEVKAELPNTMEPSYQKKLDKLRNTEPADFSSEYNPMQVSAHKDAVSLFERYAKSGDNPKLKDWAAKTLPTLEHHLGMAEDLDKKRD